jgi:hypothetical protein
LNIDNDMSKAKRAGDMRRLLAALLFYTDDDEAALGQVLHESRECGRAHHFIYAALERLRDAYGLREHPERKDDVRRMIAQHTAVENGDDQEGNNDVREHD